MSTGPIFNGPVTANNMVFGDMINSANQYVQTLGAERDKERQIYADVLGAIDASQDVPAETRKDVIEAVKVAARDPSPKGKLDLISALKAVTVGAGAVSALAKVAETAVPLLQHLVR